jgi:hypothetical protein
MNQEWNNLRYFNKSKARSSTDSNTEKLFRSNSNSASVHCMEDPSGFEGEPTICKRIHRSSCAIFSSKANVRK